MLNKFLYACDMQAPIYENYLITWMMLIHYISGSQTWLHITINEGSLEKINMTNLSFYGFCFNWSWVGYEHECTLKCQQIAIFHNIQDAEL